MRTLARWGSASPNGFGRMTDRWMETQRTRWRFRRLLTSAAEWCAPPREKGGGKKDGRRERGSDTTGTLFPPPIFSPLPPMRGAPFRQFLPSLAESPTFKVYQSSVITPVKPSSIPSGNIMSKVSSIKFFFLGLRHSAFD